MVVVVWSNRNPSRTPTVSQSLKKKRWKNTNQHLNNFVMVFYKLQFLLTLLPVENKWLKMARFKLLFYLKCFLFSG